MLAGPQKQRVEDGSIVQGSAKRWSPGCVNAAGKARKKQKAKAVTNFTKPGDCLLTELCTCRRRTLPGFLITASKRGSHPRIRQRLRGLRIRSSPCRIPRDLVPDSHASVIRNGRKEGRPFPFHALCNQMSNMVRDHSHMTSA